MKKDIEFLKVKDVHIAIVKSGEIDIEWNVFLINRNNKTLSNVFVSSYGYGGEGHEDKKTSTMRHFLGDVLPNSHHKIEGIDPALFYINNEYLLSYFIDNQLFDKKFIFVPDSITIQNCIKIEPFGLEGVLHA